MNKKKIYKDKAMMYSILINSNKEIVSELDEELYNYIYNYDKLSTNLKDVLYFENTDKFTNLKMYFDFGISALSIIDNKNILFDDNINNEIQYLKTYLDKCIKNPKYCNPTLFLAYVKDIMHRFISDIKCYTQNIPYSDKQLNDDILNKDNKQKLEAMFYNLSNIELRKDYTCNGIIDLVICSLFEIFSRNYYIKKCSNCNRYFISTRGDNRIRYCHYYAYLSKSSLTCRELKLNSDYVQKRKGNNLRAIYTTLYNKFNNRYARFNEKHLNKPKTKDIEEELKKRLSTVKKLQKLYNFDIKPKIKNGELTESEAIKMLQEFNKEVQ